MPEMRVGLVIPDLGEPVAGVGRYAVELTQALCNLSEGPEVVLVTAANQGALSSEERCVFPRRSSALSVASDILTQIVGTRLTVIAIDHLLVPYSARRLHLDVIHDLTNIVPYALHSTTIPNVVTIHDVISWSHPGRNDWLDDLIQTQWLPRVLPAADAVITVSQSSKDDVQRYLRIPRARIHTVYHGVAGTFAPRSTAEIARVRTTLNLPTRYMLYVGSLNRRKNVHLLLEACTRLWERGERTALVVAGPPSANQMDLLGWLRHRNVDRYVTFAGYVAEQDLPALYSGATLFCYPSEYEGFGLPPLEAMACGTPVVCSNSGALPEVVGDAAVTVDTNDVEALVQALSLLLTNDRLHQSLRMNGLERAASFTWATAAERTFQVYQSACRSRMAHMPCS